MGPVRFLEKGVTLPKGDTSLLVEDYPEDKRGHSHLILGRLSSGPVHICCSIHDEDVVIITVYRPDPAKWSDDWKTRL